MNNNKSDRHPHNRSIEVSGDVTGSLINTGDYPTINYNPPSTPRSPSEQYLLDSVKREVASRLKQSLHSAIFINLDMESQPQQVERPSDRYVKVGKQSPEQLPTGTTILKVFNRPEILGRLLILGKPGSGKTTTQLELAQALIERSEQDLKAPTPALFNLSTWRDERQSINAWLVAELKSKYGVRRDVGENWLKERRLLPLLDGLDELNSQWQEPCIRALNQFITGENAPLQVVVCSRLEEYERLGLREPPVKLRLNGAICLKELTDNKIQAYLASTHQSDLWDSDSALLTLLQAPLLLSLTVLAAQQGSLHQWQTLGTSQERLQSLLDAFIRSRLEEGSTSDSSRNKEGYTPRQTLQWLSWLAQQLERESKTEFLIEEIQPSWLPNPQLRKTYLDRVRLIGLDDVLVTESLSWSWSEAKNGLIGGLLFGMKAGLLFGLVVWLAAVVIGGPSPHYGLVWSSVGMMGGLMGGLSAGLIFGTKAGLIGSEVEQKSFPNQGIWKTLQAGLIQWGIVGLTVVLMVVLMVVLIWLSVRQSSWLEVAEDAAIVALMGGPSLGLIFGLTFGLIGAVSGKWSSEHSSRRSGRLTRLSVGLTRLSVALIGLTLGLIGLSIVPSFRTLVSRPYYESSWLIFGLIWLIFGLIWLIWLSGKQNVGLSGRLIWLSAGLTWLSVALIWLLFGDSIQMVRFNPPFEIPGTVRSVRNELIGLNIGLIGLNIGLIGLSGKWSSEQSGRLIWWGGWSGDALFECGKHVHLRIILHRNGYIPWNYARFLDYCTDRLLLQRVGGRYRFMHKSLQEHFAAMPFEKP